MSIGKQNIDQCAAAYFGLKCTREKVRVIFLPLSFSLSLCTQTHIHTRTLAHLPSIFRIGKVGQLHVSYASTFVPTHTHTHIYLFGTYIVCSWNTHVPHTVTHMFHYSVYACASTYRFFVSAFSTPPPPPTPLFLSIPLSLLFQLDSWPLAIIELASFASFSSCLL